MRSRLQYSFLRGTRENCVWEKPLDILFFWGSRWEIERSGPGMERGGVGQELGARRIQKKGLKGATRVQADLSKTKQICATQCRIFVT